MKRSDKQRDTISIASRWRKFARLAKAIFHVLVPITTDFSACAAAFHRNDS